jgi:hypothetical protein
MRKREARSNMINKDNKASATRINKLTIATKIERE